MGKYCSFTFVEPSVLLTFQVTRNSHLGKIGRETSASASSYLMAVVDYRFIVTMAG
jgi:hypothetical protein